MKCVTQALLTGIVIALLGACSGQKNNANDTRQEDDSLPPGSSAISGESGKDVYVVDSSEDLIGGPLADGKIGDLRMQNDKIRLIIQQPGEHDAAFGGTSGGTIYDMDLVRPEGETGQDNLLDVFPALNLEWTAYYDTLEILENDVDAYGLVRVRATGKIVVQEYIPPKLAVSGMASLEDPILGHYPARFDNALDPLNAHPDYAGLSQSLVTEYILRRGAAFVEIRTTLTNEGSTPVPFQVGNWVAAAGNMETFVPQLYFADPYLDYRLDGDISAVVFGAYEGRNSDDTRVSYGYFYDPRPFREIDPDALNGTAVMIQGVTVVAPAQQPFKVSKDGFGLIPVCDLWGGDKDECLENGDATLFAHLPPGDFTYSSYLSVGDGTVGSALGVGYGAVGVSTAPVSGRVVDASGVGIGNARVAFIDGTAPATVLTTVSDGTFSGELPTGGSWVTEKFGSGRYTVEVYSEGYWVDGSDDAGTCTPVSVDVRNGGGVTGITCTLGQTVQVKLGDIVDEASGEKIPAMLYIAGRDPSPKTRTFGDGGYDSAAIKGYNYIPYGLVDLLFYNPITGAYQGHDHHPCRGTRTLCLEPGIYEFIYYRGSEYEVEVRRVTVTANAVAMGTIALKRVVETPGYISQDYHIHARPSLDVPVPEDDRLLNAAAAGLDHFCSGDHDVITDYADAFDKTHLHDWIATCHGEEVTQFMMGHFLASFLDYQADDLPDGGALDYVRDSRDPGDATRDYSLSLQEMIDRIRENSAGEEVIHVAHILDQLLGYMALNGLVTSNGLQTGPLYTFADPVQFRLGDPAADVVGPPFAPESTENFSLDFDAIELAFASYHRLMPKLMDSALPTFFNLLNLGKRVTASINGDTHLSINEAVGAIKNYCRSPVDPMDQNGDVYSDLMSEEVRDELARNVKRQHCFITDGPYLNVSVNTEDDSASFGDTLEATAGGTATLRIQVVAPQWVEWDEVLVYVNTVPTPNLGSESVEEFYMGVPPTYSMMPSFAWSKTAGTLTTPVENGKRQSTIEQRLTLTEDSWMVILVRGNEGISNSVYPFNPMDFAETKEEGTPNHRDNLVNNLNNRFLTNEVALTGGTPFFAISNAIFIDTDGDTNDDGELWEAIYIRDGSSPLAQ